MQSVFRSMKTILLAALIILAASAAVSAQDEEVQFGEIAVSSDPPGASIYLDDVLIDKKTNGFILDVYPGIHIIRLTLPGYHDYEKIISVDSGEITYVYHEFEPRVGSLAVSSDPPGADIYLGGLYYGRTNTVISGLAEGEYAIRLSLEGYPDHNGTVRIADGETESYVHSFLLVPTTGSLRVTSEPRGATILLDDRNVGVTDRTIGDIEPGTHQIVLTKEGYRDAAAPVEIRRGETTGIFLTLTEEDGLLVVTTEPVSADVYVDGGFSGQTPFSGTFAPGPHRVDLRAHGFADHTESVELSYRGYTLSAMLTPLAPDAIAEAEARIAANRQYDMAPAEEELARARALLDAGSYAEAYDAAVRAGSYAEDVDGDGVPNIIDLQPTVTNNWIYLTSVLLLISLGILALFDWVRLNARPVIDLGIEPGEGEGRLTLRVALSIDRPYRTMICMIAHDGEVVEYLPLPGTYAFELAGIEAGSHRAVAECSVEKIRYGVVKERASLVYELLPEEPGTGRRVIREGNGAPSP
jgi:hypothetical protein